MRSDRARRRLRARSLRRDLMALLVFLFVFTVHGLHGRLEAADVPQARPPGAGGTRRSPSTTCCSPSGGRRRRSAPLPGSPARPRRPQPNYGGASGAWCGRPTPSGGGTWSASPTWCRPSSGRWCSTSPPSTGVDPRLVAAVGHVESRWNPRTVGTHNDTGLMQILPSTAQWIASRLGWSEYDLFDPWTNLHMGIWYLHVLHQEYGTWEKALAAYNGGPRHAHLGAAHPYVGRVMRAYGSQ